MRLMFWKKEPSPKVIADGVDLYNSMQADIEKVRKEAEWNALPEARKAARIEYARFKSMCGPGEEERRVQALYEAMWPYDYSHAYQNMPTTPSRSEIERSDVLPIFPWLGI